jgi:hypothetical protein
VTREEVQQVESRLRKRYPKGTVSVTRVFGGIEVEASDAGGSVFMRTADDSPLLVLLGAAGSPGDLSQEVQFRGDRRPGPDSAAAGVV